MATPAELTAKWTSRLDEWRALGVRVDGEKVATEIVSDLRALANDDVVTLAEASSLGGYSLDHLQRLVRDGKITNLGAKYRPRIRRADVPSKPGHTATTPLRSSEAADHFSRRRRIVADAQHGGT